MAQSTLSAADRKSFLREIAANPSDMALRLVYADWCEESGLTDETAHQRRIAAQTTPEGAECVTVARDGSNMAGTGGGYSVPIWCSAIYRAVRRADGLLTWRRVGDYRDSTSGRSISGPMVERAEARARERGCDYIERVRHGMVCS